MSKVVVIKVGSSLVTDSNDSIDEEFIKSVSSQIRDLVEKGFEVTVVSSGAIAVSYTHLTLPTICSV